MDAKTIYRATNYVQRNGVGGFPEGVTSQAFTYTSDNTRSGSRNPSWRTRIRGGYFVASAYTVDRVDVREQQPSHWKVKYTKTEFGTGKKFPCQTQSWGMHSAASALVIPGAVFTNGERTKSKDDAYNRLLAKIRSSHSDANGLLIIGELRDTLRMLRNPARGLHDAFAIFLSSAKREAALARTARAFAKAYSALYLEWAFGWKPLMADVEDLSRAIVNHLTAPPKRTRLSSSSDAVESVDVTTNYYTTGYADTMAALTVRSSRELSTRATAYLRESLHGDEAAPRSLAELSGFTLENFVPTLYELIPFSFLFDYISTLGDVIEGSFTAQSEVQGVVTTVRQKLSNRHTVSRPSSRAQATMSSQLPGAGEFVESCPPASVTIDRSILERTVTATVPVPSLSFTLPSMKQAQNTLMLISAFASQVRPPRL